MVAAKTSSWKWSGSIDGLGQVSNLMILKRLNVVNKYICIEHSSGMVGVEDDGLGARSEALAVVEAVGEVCFPLHAFMASLWFARLFR